MAPNESDSEASSQKDGKENGFECVYCGKPVKKFVKCGKCFNIFHESCLIKEGNMKNAKCKHERLGNYQSSLTEKEDPVDTEKKILEIENLYLKQLMKEMTEKNQVLMQNNSLLLEKIKILEGNKKNEEISFAETVKKSNSSINSNVNKTIPIVKDQKPPTKTSSNHRNSSDTSKLPHSATMTLNNKTKYNLEKNINTNTSKMQVYEQENNTAPEDTSGFITVRSRRNRKGDVGTGIFENSSFKSSKAIKDEKDKKLWLFVSRVHENVKDEDIKTYILSKGKLEENQVYARKLNTRNQEDLNYKCVLVGVPITMKEEIYKSEFWPLGIRYSRFDFTKGQHFLEKQKVLV